MSRNVITDRFNRAIRSSSSSEFRSWSSAVSTCKRVPVCWSQIMGVALGSGPHSSGKAPFSGMWLLIQQVVAIDPSDIASARNLLRSRLRGRVGGGIKSQDRRTKSSGMRLEKCRRSVHVPTLESRVSSYVWRSIRRGDGETDASEWMWWYIAGRWIEGQISNTSRINGSQIAMNSVLLSFLPLIPACSIQDKV